MWKTTAVATAAVIAAWTFGLWAQPPADTVKGWVHEAFYVTGTLSWVYMAMAVVIAARPKWIEKCTRLPLDKLYAWHRGLGIAGVALGVVHYFVKDIFGAAKPFLEPLLAGLQAAAPHSAPAEAELSLFESIWSGMRVFAIDSSIFATWLIVFIIATVYVKRIGYAAWFKMHKLLSVLFLVLTVHSVRLLESSDFMLPFGWITIAATIVGAWYSLVLLVKGAGSENTVRARIKEVQKTDGAVKLVVAPEGRLDVSLGQFVFLQTPGHEKHPFSAAEVREDGSIVLLVKALGDYTREVVPNLKPGDEALIEGGWGSFSCREDKRSQVWVAAGVGIAPFCAWMQQLAEQKEGRPAAILHWCVKSRAAEGWMEWVESLARKAGVELVVHESRANRLDPSSLFKDGKAELAAVCASSGLKKEVECAWRASGGRDEDFMHEEFVWRR